MSQSIVTCREENFGSSMPKTCEGQISIIDLESIETSVVVHEATLSDQIFTNGSALPIIVVTATTISTSSSLAFLYEEPKELRKSFFLQTFITFLMAGCGEVAAGVLLDKTSSWTFFTEIPEALVLVPALLGLKGNLEMTLASRLSTMANLGHMDGKGEKLTILYSSLALDQAQAITVSLIASIFTIMTQWLDAGKFDLMRALIVVVTALMTASATSIILASMMISVTMGARKVGLNPDNFTTPLAATTGDVVTLSCLVAFGTLFYNIREQFYVLEIILIIILILSSTVWMYVASRVKFTRHVLKHGWYSIIGAMFISSSGGYILKRSLARFPGIAMFQPVINGVGGNLVAVQSSKISTYLHRFGKLGILPVNRILTYLNPLRTFSCKERESQNALILLGLSLPGHILFTALIFLVQNGNGIETFRPTFFLIYIFFAILQVVLLLYICQVLCRVLWVLRWNPDNNAIPLLTSLGDFFGTSLLVVVFVLYYAINQNAELTKSA